MGRREGRAEVKCAARAREVLSARLWMAHWAGDVVECDVPKRWEFFVWDRHCREARERRECGVWKER